ncbi:GNAT family N-acetyltransferase [Thalassobacillus pellis]|uniref:GNAT family N-acetyltransferase n=1 Tax=Thalassobacillus pellis TaxID=748008 RepID=UPI001961C378|nr:GNAT family N-acetyltransferase [Thalassobacillus pellis]MBM7551976.1 GNAT superfamily N-acetyltransferase [Thalassobacillus pellis]
MNDLLALFEKELRIVAEVPGFTREETDYVVRHVSNHDEGGYIIYSSLPEDKVREIVRQEVEYFKGIGQEFEWKVYSHDTPPYLVDILKEKGFTIDEAEALMVLKLEGNNGLLQTGSSPVVEEITSEAGIEDIIALEEEVWKESHEDLGNRLIRDKQQDPESLYLYGVYDGDKLVSAAWMYLETNSSFASLWGGSTLEPYRGKGYYSALLAERAKKAYEKQHPYLMVDASPMSRPILEKFGFKCLAYSYGCQAPVR